MSGRGATAAWLAELAASSNQPAHLCELRFDAADGGSLYLSDAYKAFVFGGQTYTSGGHLLGFSGLTESAELRIADVTLELSGVDQTIVSAALTKNYLHRRALIWKLLIDRTTEGLILNPVLIHDGRMDGMTSDEDPISGRHIVKVSSKDQFADFERLAGRHTNPNDQNIWFPNDRAFDLNAQLAGSQTTVTWGAVRPK